MSGMGLMELHRYTGLSGLVLLNHVQDWHNGYFVTLLGTYHSRTCE